LTKSNLPYFLSELPTSSLTQFSEFSPSPGAAGRPCRKGRDGRDLHPPPSAHRPPASGARTCSPSSSASGSRHLCPFLPVGHSTSAAPLPLGLPAAATARPLRRSAAAPPAWHISCRSRPLLFSKNHSLFIFLLVTLGLGKPPNFVLHNACVLFYLVQSPIRFMSWSCGV